MCVRVCVHRSGWGLVAYSSGQVLGVVGECDVSDTVSGVAERLAHLLQRVGVQHGHRSTGEPHPYSGPGETTSSCAGLSLSSIVLVNRN